MRQWLTPPHPSLLRALSSPSPSICLDICPYLPSHLSLLSPSYISFPLTIAFHSFFVFFLTTDCTPLNFLFLFNNAFLFAQLLILIPSFSYVLELSVSPTDASHLTLSVSLSPSPILVHPVSCRHDSPGSLPAEVKSAGTSLSEPPSVRLSRHTGDQLAFAARFFFSWLLYLRRWFRPSKSFGLIRDARGTTLWKRLFAMVSL